MRSLVIATLALGVATPLNAQLPTGGMTVIHAGRLLDRPGAAPRGPSTIIVENGRIVRVEVGFAAAPQGARVIDLRNRFVLPGLIDSHVHLDSDAGGNAALVESVTNNPPEITLRT